MKWNLSTLENKVKAYNRIYFANTIELPIKVIWDKRLKTTIGDTSMVDNVHVIRLNVRMQNSSSESMKEILLHELIHAWQFEAVSERTTPAETVSAEYHDIHFNDKAAEISSKAKLSHNISTYVDDKLLKNINKTRNSAYYVYREDSYKEDDGTTVKYPIGFFVKFLSDAEVAQVKKNGLQVKYFNDVKFSDKCRIKSLRGKGLVDTADLRLLTYAEIKHLLVYDIGEYKSYLFIDDDFNYEKGLKV